MTVGYFKRARDQRDDAPPHRREFRVMTRWPLALALCIAVASLSCRDRGHAPDGPGSPSNDETSYFAERAAAVGIDFRHETDPPGSFFMPEIMGSGCALFDFDRDGDLDALLVNLGAGYATGQRSHTVTHRLYEQVAGNRFVDVSEKAAFKSQGLGMGVAIGDVNNDGWPDVYFTSYGPDQLYLNRGDGHFEDVTTAAGIENLLWGASACFVDYDRDGWLDLFIANYLDYADRACTRVGGGNRDYCGPQLFPGTTAKLFRNVTGEAAGPDQQPTKSIGPNVRFQDVSVESGIAAKPGPGLGVAAADFNGDGWPDLYVANDQTANHLWINQRNGRFVDEAIERGCAYDAQGNAQASMGVAVGDPDGDLDLDLFLTHLDGEHNTLYLQRSEGQFEDSSSASGLGATTHPFTGFGTGFFDLDRDGDEDLVMVDGRVKRPTEATAKTAALESPTADFWQPYRQRGQLFLNDGAGSVKFRDVTSRTDALLTNLSLSRGLAMGDIDNDGDIDLLVNRTGELAALYINEQQPSGAWVRLKVVAPRWGGRDAYGALVTIVSAGGKIIRLLQPGTSYMSSHDARIHVGLGKIERLEHVDVVWPDGVMTTFPIHEINREHVLERPGR